MLLAAAMGFETPIFAHLPLILSTDRRKMSKRFDDVALDEYKVKGYSPEAVLNFIAFLGWHPVEEKDVMSREELIKEFDLKRVQKAGAIFNVEKLDWLNAQYTKNTDATKLIEKLKGFIPDEWFDNKELLIKVIEIQKERVKKLSDFRELADFFFELPDYDEKLLIWPRQTLSQSERKNKILLNLKMLNEEIGKIFKVDFYKENLEKIIMPLTEVWGRGELLWPLRAALSGKETSPGPIEIMDALDKEETLRRIQIAIDKLS